MTPEELKLAFYRTYPQSIHTTAIINRFEGLLTADMAIPQEAKDKHWELFKKYIEAKKALVS